MTMSYAPLFGPALLNSALSVTLCTPCLAGGKRRCLPPVSELAVRDVSRDLDEHPHRGAGPALGGISVGLAFVEGGTSNVHMCPAHAIGHKFLQEQAAHQHSAMP